MAEVQKVKSPTLPLSPDVINEVVDTKEKIPVPETKVRVLPLIVLGLAISVAITIIGFVILKLIQSGNAPDLVINAPSVINPSVTPVPTPTGETTTIVPQNILFEPTPYRNELARFEIQVPQGWKIDDSGNSGTIVVLVDPKATLASGSAVLTFISVSTGQSNNTLDDEVKVIRDGLLKSFDSYVIEEDKQMLLSSDTYHLIGGTYMLHGIKIRNRNLILVHNNRGYAIQATAPESVWSKRELLLNASIFSFRPF